MSSVRSNRNFISLLLMRIFSNAGDSLYYVGTMWLVYELTGSVFYTGLAGFFVRIPQVVGFLVGPFVDRWNLQRILVRTQLLQACLLVVIPISFLAGYKEVTLVLFIILASSIIDRFVYPAQRAIVPNLVEEDNLVKANSLLSSTNKSIDLLFTSVGGFLITFVGVVAFYFVDSLLFFLAAGAALFIDYTRDDGDSQPEETADLREEVRNYGSELKVGFRYIYDTVVTWFVLRSAILNFANGMMVAVLPDYASSLGGSGIYGILLAAISVGILIGSLGASFVETVPYGKLVISGDLISGVVWASAILSADLIPTIVLFGAAWIPVGVTKVVYNSTLQANVSSEHLGRVSSTSASISRGLMPLGSLAGGAFGQAFGSELTALLLGPMFVLMALGWLAYSPLRRLPKATDISMDLGT